MKNPILEILCEINNRLIELTQTLQTIAWLKECKPEDKVIYLSKLMQLEAEQKEKYASVTYS